MSTYIYCTVLYCTAACRRLFMQCRSVPQSQMITSINSHRTHSLTHWHRMTFPNPLSFFFFFPSIIEHCHKLISRRLSSLYAKTRRRKSLRKTCPSRSLSRSTRRGSSSGSSDSTCCLLYSSTPLLTSYTSTYRRKKREEKKKNETT